MVDYEIDTSFDNTETIKKVLQELKGNYLYEVGQPIGKFARSTFLYNLSIEKLREKSREDLEYCLWYYCFGPSDFHKEKIARILDFAFKFQPSETVLACIIYRASRMGLVMFEAFLLDLILEQKK